MESRNQNERKISKDGIGCISHLPAHWYSISKYITVLLLVIAFLFMVSFNSNAEIKKQTPKDAVVGVLNAWEHHTLTKIKLNHFKGNDIEIHSEITQDGLVAHSSRLIIEADYGYLRGTRAWQAILQALKQFTFEHLDKKVALDLYLSCQFYENDTEMLRIVIARNYPIVLINGEPYKLTTEFLLSFSSLLPDEVTQEIYEDTIRGWIYSRD